MNFYTAQDQARKSSKLLLLLFTMLNLGLIVLINLIFAWYLWANSDPVQASDRVLLDYLNWQRLLYVSIGVILLLLFAAWLKWMDVRQGGGWVAEMLGGEHVNRSEPDPSLHQLLNVVEEMALASGVPVPPVYVMRHESGINAFAAGLGLKDAAICVTRGAVDKLSRERLQGVIAHEFSHILNGDMRLNMRILIVLNGMVFFGELGRDLVSRRSSWFIDANRSKGLLKGSLPLLGLGLFVIGWFGVMSGRLIKAAISRQHEYLADASAVQFTRNPAGIADALKLIGGEQESGYVRHQASEEVSHMFFSAVRSEMLWSTHPPLEKRIRRLDPNWDGLYLKGDFQPEVTRSDKIGLFAQKSKDIITGSYFEKESLPDLDFVVNALPLALDPTLINLAYDPYSSRAVLLGLLLDKQADISALQLKEIEKSDRNIVYDVKECLPKLSKLPRNQYLELIELCIASLKSLSCPQYKEFKRLLIKVINADKEIDLYEWSLYQLVCRFCDAHFGIAREKQNRYTEIGQLSGQYAQVLSTLAHYGSSSEAEAAKAFNRGAGTAGLYTLRILERSACDREAFSTAVSALAEATPFIKQRLLRGMIKLIHHDGKVVAVERELITAVAAVMESPLVGLDDQGLD